jgi:hypothetical protein
MNGLSARDTVHRILGRRGCLLSTQLGVPRRVSRVGGLRDLGEPVEDLVVAPLALESPGAVGSAMMLACPAS